VAGRRFALHGLLIVGFLPGVAAAAPPADAVRAHYNPAFLDCRANAHAVRPVQHCYALEIERQRAALDDLVNVRTAALPRAQAADFAAAQADWDRATDTRCMPPASRRGSLASQIAQACFLDRTIERIMALEARR